MPKEKQDVTPSVRSNRHQKTLQYVLDKCRASKEYVDKLYTSKWEDAYKAYHNIRTKEGYEGIADTFIPEIFTEVESIVANLGAATPKFEFIPTNIEQTSDVRALNHLIEFWWRCNKMQFKSQQWVRDSIMYGTGVLFVWWEDDKPRIKNIPIWDFIIDPNATNLEDAKYAGHKYEACLEDLKMKKIYNAKKDKMVPKYKNLNKIMNQDTESEYGTAKNHKENIVAEGNQAGRGGGYGGGDETGKQLGGGNSGRSPIQNDGETIEIVYICDRIKNKVYEVANGTTVIYEGKNPYQSGPRYKEVREKEELFNPFTGEYERQTVKKKKKRPEIKRFFPYSVMRNYVDTCMFYGTGDIERVLPLQERLNDVTNMQLDNLEYQIHNMWQIDPQYKHLMEDIKSAPGAILPIPKHALTPLNKPQATNAADIMSAQTKEVMRRTTAANEVVQGTISQGDRTTATAVQAQINQSSQRFATKLRNIENEGFCQLGKILFWMAQIFVDTEVAVRVLGPERGVEWINYFPEDYDGDFEPKVALEGTTRQLRAEEGQKYQNLYQILLNNPNINQQAAMQLLLPKIFPELDEIDLAKILSGTIPPPQPPAPQAPPGINPQQLGQPPTGPVTSNPQDLSVRGLQQVPPVL